MSSISRRRFIGTTGAMGLGAAGLLAGCANGVGNGGAQRLDARVDATRDFLFGRYPGTRDLAQKSAGVLYMPLITEAGFGIGGAFGQGACASMILRSITIRPPAPPSAFKSARSNMPTHCFS